MTRHCLTEMSTALLFGLIAFILSIKALSFTDNEWTAPWFCHNLNCPKYKNPKNMSIGGKVIEIRSYESASWISTLVQNTNLHTAENIGFHRGFDYISGANAAKAKISMTSPVLNYVEPAQGPLCTTNFTVSFYAPYKYQAPNQKAPQPTDPSVYLNEIQTMRVGVISFDGFAEDNVVISKAAELNGLLAQSGVAYDHKNWFFAGYDPPFRVSDRHNEVWIKIYNHDMQIMDVAKDFEPERRAKAENISAAMYFCSGSLFTFALIILYVLFAYNNSAMLNL